MPAPLRSPLALACLLLAASPAGARRATTAKTPVPAESGRGIANETYRLANGMTVILHVDRTRPVATINVWYGVGSKDEAPGRSGFAHLFEHLMFMGTERAPGAEFDQIMESGGGWNNASTSFDRTNYYSTGPSSLLPTLLWLDADRLEDLGRMMTQEKLDKQREIVRNERRQSDENRPYGMADLAIDAAMFPLGHPYHWSVIGTHEDLQAATVEDVKQFFATFYVPSNASLVVAGDFDPATVKPLVERLFGTLQEQPVPPHGKAAPVRLDGVKRLTMTDDVQLDRVTLAWHSPPLYADGDADLDVLAGVLAGGKSSRLWQRLVRETQLCAEVTSWQGSRELQSIFEIEALCPPESSLDEVERVIDAEVARIAKEGPTDDEVARERNRIEKAKLAALDTLLGLADQLNQYQHYRGKPDSLAWDLDRYARVTPGTVRSWAGVTCDPDRRLIVRVVGEDPRARPDGGPEAVAFRFPRPETWTLDNGLTVHLWRRTDLPLVSTRLLLRAGAMTDGPGMAGRTSLALDMLDEGTKTLSAPQFAAALDALGASMEPEVQRDWSTVSLSSLARTFDRAFALFADAVTEPAFDPTEFDRVKSLRLDDLRQRDDDPSQLAVVVSSRELNGASSPLAWPVEGEVSTCAKLTLNDVGWAAQRVLAPDGAALLVAGDVDRATLDRLVSENFAAWKSPGPTFPPPAAMPRTWDDRDVRPPPRAPLRVVLVPREDAVQTVVRFAWSGPTYSDPDRLPLRVVNTVLGGSFTSRLNQNLREAHGYTYGAASRFAAERLAGSGVAYAAVRADVTEESLKELLLELDRMRDAGPTDEERAKAIASARNAMVDATEGLDGLVSQAADLLGRGRTYDDFDADFAALDDASTASLKAVAARRVVPREGVVTLIGDETIVRKAVANLGLGEPSIVSADPGGDPGTGATAAESRR